MAEKVDQIAAEIGANGPLPIIVSEDEFVQRYQGEHFEWVNGVLIKMSASSLRHILLIGQLYLIFRTYLEQRPIARLLNQPFAMRLESSDHISRREPDLMLVLNEHQDRIKATYLDGPADLVIEVVSPESSVRDHVEKLTEYEAGGVPEYWIIDPQRRETRFFQLDAAGGKYVAFPAVGGVYQTPQLPGLRLPVADFWLEEYPGPSAVLATIREMLQTP